MCSKVTSVEGSDWCRGCPTYTPTDDRRRHRPISQPSDAALGHSYRNLSFRRHSRIGHLEPVELSCARKVSSYDSLFHKKHDDIRNSMAIDHESTQWSLVRCISLTKKGACVSCLARISRWQELLIPEGKFQARGQMHVEKGRPLDDPCASIWRRW